MAWHGSRLSLSRGHFGRRQSRKADHPGHSPPARWPRGWPGPGEGVKEIRCLSEKSWNPKQMGHFHITPKLPRPVLPRICQRQRPPARAALRPSVQASSSREERASDASLPCVPHGAQHCSHSSLSLSVSPWTVRRSEAHVLCLRPGPPTRPSLHAAARTAFDYRNRAAFRGLILFLTQTESPGRQGPCLPCLPQGRLPRDSPQPPASRSVAGHCWHWSWVSPHRRGVLGLEGAQQHPWPLPSRATPSVTTSNVSGHRPMSPVGQTCSFLLWTASWPLLPGRITDLENAARPEPHKAAPVPEKRPRPPH